MSHSSFLCHFALSLCLIEILLVFLQTEVTRLPRLCGYRWKSNEDCMSSWRLVFTLNPVYSVANKMWVSGFLLVLIMKAKQFYSSLLVSHDLAFIWWIMFLEMVYCKQNKSAISTFLSLKYNFQFCSFNTSSVGVRDGF